MLFQSILELHEVDTLEKLGGAMPFQKDWPSSTKGVLN